jgi:hypothetical protein
MGLGRIDPQQPHVEGAPAPTGHESVPIHRPDDDGGDAAAAVRRGPVLAMWPREDRDRGREGEKRG